MNPETRFSGHWIVAAQGTGKTNLLLHMLASDLRKDASIIIMDSKRELTGAIRNLALGDRLIVVDPASDTPVAINPFDVVKSEHVTSQLGYMLAGLLETNITPKQRTFFETLVGLMNKKFTRAILSAPKTKFNIGKAMDHGKVVVIDNAQAKCTQEGCGFIGRLFVAQIWSAGTARALIPDHLKKPTYVYINEAHVVIKKDQKIAAIIDELRSQKIALILAHQKLRGQIDDINVLSALENCAIKMVNVGAGERDYFSKLLGIPPERMKDLPRGHFATDIRWEGTSIKRVPKAQLPFRTMTDEEQRAHQERMDALYGYVPPPMAPIQPTTPKLPEGGSSEHAQRDTQQPARVEQRFGPIRPNRSIPPITSKPGLDPHTGDHTEPASKWGDE